MDGYWKASAQPLLAKFLKDPKAQDQQVTAICSKASDPGQAYLTLLALHILEEFFSSRSGEWKLLAKKAKEWLKVAGIEKPDQAILEFTLELKF
jgi:hypothetical protein